MNITLKLVHMNVNKKAMQNKYTIDSTINFNIKTWKHIEIIFKNNN